MSRWVLSLALLMPAAQSLANVERIGPIQTGRATDTAQPTAQSPVPVNPLRGRNPSALRARFRGLVRPDAPTAPLAMVSTPRLTPIAVDHSRFNPLIIEAASAHGLSASLLRAVIAVESAFNPDAISSKGAQGLMQLMPATATRFGVIDPFDPAQNIEGGARYLAWLLDEFGSLELALAGYNAGEAAVRQYDLTIPPYPETQIYVHKVLAAITQ